MKCLYLRSKKKSAYFFSFFFFVFNYFFYLVVSYLLYSNFFFSNEYWLTSCLIVHIFGTIIKIQGIPLTFPDHDFYLGILDRKITCVLCINYDIKIMTVLINSYQSEILLRRQRKRELKYVFRYDILSKMLKTFLICSFNNLKRFICDILQIYKSRKNILLNIIYMQLVYNFVFFILYFRVDL